MSPSSPAPDSDPLPAKSADRWLTSTAARLAHWGHGIVAPDPDSGGLAISGLANSRGCCAQPQPSQDAGGVFASSAPMTDTAVCLHCHRAVPLTLWARWDSPGAVSVANRLAASRPLLPAPPHRAGTPRPIPREPGRRLAARWARAGLPSPAAAVAAAEDGRGSQQSQLAHSSDRRCNQLLASLPRRGDTLTVAAGTASRDLVRIGTQHTHGVTLFEPELIVGDEPGAVSVAWLSPVDEHGELVVPAALERDDHPVRSRHDERHWHEGVSSQHVAVAQDVDPAGLVLRAVPYRLLSAGVLRPHRNRHLSELVRQALAGGLDTAHGDSPPAWLIGEDVENRLRNLLIDDPEPVYALDIDQAVPTRTDGLGL